MKKEANLNDNLRQLGIDIHNDYSKIISNVNLQRLKNNPIKIERKDLKKILTSLMNTSQKNIKQIVTTYLIKIVKHRKKCKT